MKIANQEATSNMSDFFFFFNATRSVPQQNLMFRRWVRLQRGQRQKRGMKPHCLVCLSFLIRYSEKKASPFLSDSPFFSNPLFLWKISNPPFYKYLETSLPLKGGGGEVGGFPLWTYGFDIVLANSRARESEIGDGERDL